MGFGHFGPGCCCGECPTGSNDVFSDSFADDSQIALWTWTKNSDKDVTTSSFDFPRWVSTYMRLTRGNFSPNPDEACGCYRTVGWRPLNNLEVGDTFLFEATLNGSDYNNGSIITGSSATDMGGCLQIRLPISYASPIGTAAMIVNFGAANVVVGGSSLGTYWCWNCSDLSGASSGYLSALTPTGGDKIGIRLTVDSFVLNSGTYNYIIMNVEFLVNDVVEYSDVTSNNVDLQSSSELLADQNNGTCATVCRFGFDNASYSLGGSDLFSYANKWDATRLARVEYVNVTKT